MIVEKPDHEVLMTGTAVAQNRENNRTLDRIESLRRKFADRDKRVADRVEIVLRCHVPPTGGVVMVAEIAVVLEFKRGSDGARFHEEGFLSGLKIPWFTWPLSLHASGLRVSENGRGTFQLWADEPNTGQQSLAGPSNANTQAFLENVSCSSTLI
jgi:hypothetical protein